MTTRKRLYPWASALPKNISVSLATLWGLGDLKAPGTWGSAAGLLFYALLFDGIGLGRYFVFAVLLAYLATGICDAAERHLKMRDPGKIILDEFVAMPFCFLPIMSGGYSALGIILGFAVFRFLDIKKPVFINSLQNLDGGLGCVADDIAAAVLTCAILNLLSTIVPSVLAY